jgi:hypothetical protein
MGDEVIKGEKNPVVALILNLCVLGVVGYFYIGQWQKALVALLVIIVTSGFGVGVVVWIAGLVDVYMQAKALKEGKGIKHWTFFSQTA